MSLQAIKMHSFIALPYALPRRLAPVHREILAMTRIPVGAPSRSVTALGWAFVALGATVPAALALPDVRASAGAVVGIAVLAMLLAVAGVGLLQRLDWARRAFIVMLGSALGLLGLAVWPQLQWLQHAASIEVPLVALVTSLGLGGLLAWAILSLISPRVRREFA
jgi:hypothetical protein